MIETSEQASAAVGSEPHNHARRESDAAAAVSERKIAANRRNALRSTGPKTTRGKARSSRNARKHGLLAASPIIPGAEDRMAWEDHRAGLFESWAPVGYQEELFVEQMATMAWEKARNVRYLAHVAEASITAAESDLGELAGEGAGKPEDPETALNTAHDESRIIDTLAALPKMNDGEKLNKGVAVGVWSALVEAASLGDGTLTKSVPGIPDDETAFNAFDNWTVGLLRKAVQVYAGAAGMTPDALRNKSISFAREKHDAALDEANDLTERGKRWKHVGTPEGASHSPPRAAAGQTGYSRPSAAAGIVEPACRHKTDAGNCQKTAVEAENASLFSEEPNYLP